MRDGHSTNGMTHNNITSAGSLPAGQCRGLAHHITPHHNRQVDTTQGKDQDTTTW